MEKENLMKIVPIILPENYLDILRQEETPADVVEQYRPAMGSSAIRWVNHWHDAIPAYEARTAVASACPNLVYSLRDPKDGSWLFLANLRWNARKLGILPEVERVMLEHLAWRHDQLVRFLNDPNHNT